MKFKKTKISILTSTSVARRRMPRLIYLRLEKEKRACWTWRWRTAVLSSGRKRSVLGSLLRQRWILNQKRPCVIQRGKARPGKVGIKATIMNSNITEKVSHWPCVEHTLERRRTSCWPNQEMMQQKAINLPEVFHPLKLAAQSLAPIISRNMESK